MSPLSDLARTRLRTAVVVTAAIVAIASPWWARFIASQLSFFRVRRVEIVGVRYVAPGDIVARLRVDTTRSVWDDPTPLERRVASHPQVGSVSIRRKLPGTLVVSVVENMPIAMVSTEKGFLGMTRSLLAVADEVAGGRIAAVLEGGYDLDAIRGSTEVVLAELSHGAREHAPVASRTRAFDPLRDVLAPHWRL